MRIVLLKRKRFQEFPIRLGSILSGSNKIP